MTLAAVIVRCFRRNVSSMRGISRSCAMLPACARLDAPLSAGGESHSTASVISRDGTCVRTCLVQHVKLERLLPPGDRSSRRTSRSSPRRCARRIEVDRLAVTLHSAAKPRPCEPSTSTRSRVTTPVEPLRDFHLDVRVNPRRWARLPGAGSAWYPPNLRVSERSGQSSRREGAQPRKPACDRERDRGFVQSSTAL